MASLKPCKISHFTELLPEVICPCRDVFNDFIHLFIPLFNTVFENLPCGRHTLPGTGDSVVNMQTKSAFMAPAVLRARKKMRATDVGARLPGFESDIF